MKLFLVLIPFALTRISAQSPVPERGENLAAFRTVLDEKPRVLVIRMGKEQALAFDCENGILWKFWQANPGELPVKLRGAVYNGEHGPQPVSQGKVLFTDDQPQLTCSVSETHLQYLGHLRLRDGTCTLRWAFRDGENMSLGTIAVSPALVNGSVALRYKLEAEPVAGIKISVRPPGSGDDPEPLTTEPLLITLGS